MEQRRTDLDASLRRLHDIYAYEVNAAVAEDRLDRVHRLSEEYADEALAVILRGAA